MNRDPRRDPLDEWGGDYPHHQVTGYEDQGPRRLRFACSLLMVVGLYAGLVVWAFGTWRGWWG